MTGMAVALLPGMPAMAGATGSREKDPVYSYVQKNFPELGQSDLNCITEYLRAYQEFRRAPLIENLFIKNRLDMAKSTLLRLIAHLENKHCASPWGSQERMHLLRRLIAFERLARAGLPINELKTVIGNARLIGPAWASRSPMQMSDILVKTGVMEIAPEQLPEDITKLLAGVAMAPGYSYLQFINDNTASIVFTPRVKDVSPAMAIESAGACEEISRTVVLASLDNFFGAKLSAWDLAITLVHETAHIKWYHDNAASPKRLSFNPNERYARIMQYYYCAALLRSDLPISKNDRESIEKGINGMGLAGDWVRSLNKQLGYPLNDFSTHK